MCRLVLIIIFALHFQILQICAYFVWDFKCFLAAKLTRAILRVHKHLIPKNSVQNDRYNYTYVQCLHVPHVDSVSVNFQTSRQLGWGTTRGATRDHTRGSLSHTGVSCHCHGIASWKRKEKFSIRGQIRNFYRRC